MPSGLILGSNMEDKRLVFEKINLHKNFQHILCSPYDTSLYENNVIYIADRVFVSGYSKLDFVIFVNKTDDVKFYENIKPIFPNTKFLFNSDIEGPESLYTSTIEK